MNLRFFSLSLAAIACIALGRQAFAQAGNNNPGGVTSDFHGSITTAGYYDPYTGNAKREITDIVVPGSIGAYPLTYTRTFNSRGPGWSNNFIWSVAMYDPYFDQNGCGPDIEYCDSVGHVDYPSGGSFELFDFDSPWHLDANGRNGPDDLLFDCAKAESQCNPGARFEIWRADGGKVLFQAPPNAHTFRAYAIIDPYGQTTTLGYDSGGRISKVTEPGGRYLQWNYQPYTYLEVNGQWVTVYILVSIQAYAAPGNLIETVTYGYGPGGGITRGPLTKVYYADGAVATYTYGDTYTTCDDPRYAGPMKQIEYEYVPEGYFIARGQIKAERNFNTHQVVSQITHPTSYTDPNLLIRTETRGDGFSRTLDYRQQGQGFTWTDFKNHTSSDQTLPNNDGWQITDARMNVTRYNCEGVPWAVWKITYPQTDPNQPPATREYTFSDPDYPYYRTGEKDENGNWTYFDRDPTNPDPNKRGQLRQIRYPDNSTEEFTYNGFGQVETHKLRTGGVENFRYDARGLKTLYWPPPTPSDPNPDQHKTVYTYYEAADGHPAWIDRLKCVTDPRGNATCYEYNLRGQVTKVTHQDGYYTQSEYNLDGTLKWTADENHPNAWMDGHDSERTRYTYDEYKRVLTVTNPMGETTTNWYGLDANWQNPLLHTTNCAKYTLSPMGKNVIYEYDENFRKKYQGVAIGTADAAETRFDYDEVGNLTWTRDPRFNVTTFGYDQRNRKISMNDPIATDRNSNGHTMEWQYDGVGNKLKEIRADDAFRTWEYDVPNRITRAIDWRMNVSETAVTTTYTRDLPNAQNVTIERTIDAKLAEYKFEFDALHRKMSETYPPAYNNSSPTEHYWYDVAGNLRLYKNPAGQYKHLDFVDSYDSRNRLRHSAWNTSPTNATADWSVGQEIRTNYDDASRMTQITTNGSETIVDFGYDSANRKTSEDQTLAGYPARHIETPRDADGNRSRLSVTVYGGLYYGLIFDYNQRNQLWNIYGNDNSRVAGYTYDAAGNVMNECVYWIYANGTNYSYDGLNRTATLDLGDAGAVFQHNHYQYDKVGREVARWRDEQASKGERFSYNRAGHLRRAEYDADNVATENTSNWSKFREYNYTPDLLNWMSVNDNGYLAPFANNDLNQYTGINGFVPQYDGNFNQTTTYSGQTFVYNAQNQVVGGSMQATYDGLGRCLRRTVGGSTLVLTYDEWNPIVEWDAGGSWKAWTIYGAKPDEVLCRLDATHGALMYKRDNQGNVVFLLDGSNRRIEQYTYDVFGRATVTSWDYPSNSWKPPSDRSSFGNRFMYTGREWIAEIRHYDYRHRLYNPDTGRFLQTDPTGFDAGDMNLFRYCDDDPVDRSDPMGLQATPGPTGSTIDARMRLFYGDNSGGSLYELAHPESSSRTVAQISFEKAPSLGPGEAKIQKGRRILARQTKEGEDSTGAFVNGEPVPGDRNWKGQQVLYRFGKPVYKNPNASPSLRRVDHIEEPVPPRSELLTHYHTRTGYTSDGRSLAEPTDFDMRILKTTGAMLFSNPFLKKEGAYRIYRNGVPGYETRHDLYDP